MIERQPYLPRFMAGGPGNPLGARALYLGTTVYRIHGTNQPETIGEAVSSGCFRLANGDVIDLYSRVDARREGHQPASPQLERRANRPSSSQRGDEGRLVARGVLAGALCRARAVAFGVEHVVGDLERGAERLAVAQQRRAPRSARRRRRSRQPRRRSAAARRSSSPAAARSPRRPSGASRVSASMSSIWPPTMPAIPLARARPRHSAARTSRVRVRSRDRPESRRRASAARRRRGSRSPRRTPCARSAGRGADRRRPSPADRRGPANSSARIRSRAGAQRRPRRRRRSARAVSIDRNGRSRLPPPSAP